MKAKPKKLGRPFGLIPWGVKRVPQIRVSRPVYHLLEYLAAKSTSARIFLQHLNTGGKK